MKKTSSIAKHIPSGHESEPSVPDMMDEHAEAWVNMYALYAQEAAERLINPLHVPVDPKPVIATGLTPEQVASIQLNLDVAEQTITHNFKGRIDLN